MMTLLDVLGKIAWVRQDFYPRVKAQISLSGVQVLLYYSLAQKLKPPNIKESRKTISKIVSEYDQEIPQSQTADNPVAPRGRAAQPSRDTRKTN